VRENWRDPGYWRWLWRTRVPAGGKVAAIAALVALLLVGGYLSSKGLAGASASAGKGPGSYVLETTVTKVQTVEEHGRTVVRRVPVVVRRTVVRSQTELRTLTDTRLLPGSTRFVTKRVVDYVPVVKRRVIHVNGKTTTVTETRLVPTVRTETLTNVVTNQQTVTNSSTVVVNHTDTVVQPVTTVDVRTVTLPPQTVTVTETRTETVTQTVISTVLDTTTVVGTSP
jgi:hypothetical protein